MNRNEFVYRGEVLNDIIANRIEKSNKKSVFLSCFNLPLLFRSLDGHPQLGSPQA